MPFQSLTLPAPSLSLSSGKGKGHLVVFLLAVVHCNSAVSSPFLRHSNVELNTPTRALPVHAIPTGCLEGT
jgi:hypothetical protein